LPVRKGGKARGQAAIEYLSVFGWAIAVVLVFMSVLYFTGAFGSQNAVPRQCEFQRGFSCTSVKLMKNESGFQLVLAGYNGFGYDIGFDENATSATFENLGAEGAATTVGDCSPAVVRNGKAFTCVYTIGETARVPATGEMERGTVSVAYHNCAADPGYSSSGDCSRDAANIHSLSGTVSAPIEPYSGIGSCGNMQCDTRLGEDADNCPEDCARHAQGASISAEPAFVQAGGSSSNITATFFDQFGAPYDGCEVLFQRNASEGTLLPETDFTGGDGSATSVLTSGAGPASLLVTATCENESAHIVVRIVE
jgi:hypothetical protein